MKVIGRNFLVVRSVASEVVPETNFAVDRKAKMQK
jgi:hypothetical protein